MSRSINLNEMSIFFTNDRGWFFGDFEEYLIDRLGADDFKVALFGCKSGYGMDLEVRVGELRFQFFLEYHKLRGYGHVFYFETWSKCRATVNGTLMNSGSPAIVFEIIRKHVNLKPLIFKTK